MVNFKQSWDLEDSLLFEKDDLFERKQFWEGLSNLIINSQNESLVLSVNAPWWEWKTHFLKMWRNYLRDSKELNVIYFNSFKNDYIEDPFIALLWEILNYYKSEKTTYDNIKTKWKNVLKWILPLAWKIWARILLWWDIKWVDDELEKLIEWDFVDYIWQTLDEYNEKEETLKIFKNTLEEIIKSKWQLVFIIDDLDRCRPDFALRLLERIKHFFDIKGLYFVLGLDKEQLEHFIRKIYWDINVSVYLQKFIDFETLLPKNFDERENNHGKYIKNLIKSYEWFFLEKMDKHQLDYIETIFIELAISRNISLRETEKLINYLVIFFKSLTSKNHLYLPVITSVIIFTKLFDIKFYNKLKLWKLEKNELIQLLNLQNLRETYKEYILNEVDFIFDIDLDQDKLKQFSRLNSYGVHSNNYNWRQNILKIHFKILESYNI